MRSWLRYWPLILRILHIWLFGNHSIWSSLRLQCFEDLKSESIFLCQFLDFDGGVGIYCTEIDVVSSKRALLLALVILLGCPALNCMHSIASGYLQTHSVWISQKWKSCNMLLQKFHWSFAAGSGCISGLPTVPSS